MQNTINYLINMKYFQTIHYLFIITPNCEIFYCCSPIREIISWEKIYECLWQKKCIEERSQPMSYILIFFASKFALRFFEFNMWVKLYWTLWKHIRLKIGCDIILKVMLNFSFMKSLLKKIICWRRWAYLITFSYNF